MGLTTAERNRRKRERKKREREERKKQEEQDPPQAEAGGAGETDVALEDVEIEYVEDTIGGGGANASEKSLPDGVPQAVDEESIEVALQRFQQRAAVTVVVTDDERGTPGVNESLTPGDGDSDDDGDTKNALSKRKIRELLRPSVADLKRRVKRPDLVEAHDVTAADPDFLICLKGVPGTVSVPRHWGRKRKYLQGKRGFEKPPFQLPDFIVKTGITALRDTVASDEAKLSVKQKNRMRVAPKMGAIDVDYRTLYEAFFKHQSKPKNMTGFGDLYFEGKELETRTDIKPGGPLSKALREALGMTSDSSPPPWLVNMQRYGPPPSYPGLKIPGLNAPLPNDQCQYGYHPGGWGKPPVDSFGRPLYGGNPFGKPGKSEDDAMLEVTLVTSDGKALGRKNWGELPSAEFTHTNEGGDDEDEEEEEDESSDEELEESEGEIEEEATDGTESVLPPPARLPTTTAPEDLRKQPGYETPVVSSTRNKQLYQVLDQTKADTSAQPGTVFASEVAYVLPPTAPTATPVPEGAESVLSKALPSSSSSKQKRKHDDDDESEEFNKKFKF